MIYRLSDSLTGKRYKIVAVNLTEKQTAKLDKLGIFPGETVTITKKNRQIHAYYRRERSGDSRR